MLIWLSEKQLSAETGIPNRTFQRYRCFDKGPPYRKLGGHVRYSRADFERWVAAQHMGGDLRCLEAATP